MAIGVCKGCKQVKDIEYRKELLCRQCYMRKYYAKDKLHDRPKKPKRASEFTKSALVEVIKMAKISHKWMLTDIKHRADDCETVEYSDELKHAIKVQELLDLI